MPLSPADLQDSVESAMRSGLAQGDGVMAGVGPVLRHLLVNDDRDYVADDILAALRGMIADVARQVAGEESPMLTRALVDVPGLVAQAHALACEGQLTRRLRETQGIDPVLSPLMQALIASPRGEMAALAMQVLAAQARFVQHQRRMQWPLAELPAELLHGALQAWRTVSGDDAVREENLRADYDEGATRLSLLARLIAQMGAGSVAGLDLSPRCWRRAAGKDAGPPCSPCCRAMSKGWCSRCVPVDRPRAGSRGRCCCCTLARARPRGWAASMPSVPRACWPRPTRCRVGSARRWASTIPFWPVRAAMRRTA
jgi:hypothetical protein